MALYNVRVRVEYTVDMNVEGVESADEAKRRAALIASEAVEAAFEEELRTVGEAKSIEATCVTEFA